MNTSKNRSKYIAVVLAAAAFGASCTDEVPAIPDSELYTREWVKAFGAINPNQDWNTAAAGSVNVTTDAPATVRVTAVIQGTNYLLANYSDVSGSRCLTFDIPKGVKEVTVSCGNERVKTTLGGNVSFATSGRAVNNGTHGSNPTVTIETLSGDHSYLTLDRDEVMAYSSVLTEQKTAVPDYETTNLGEVTQNFMAEASEFYIFPQYWNTNNYTDNCYGIYYYVDEGTEGATKVTDTSGNEHYIVKVDIFKGHINQLQENGYGDVWEWNNHDNKILPYVEKLMEMFPERYRKAVEGETLTENTHGQISTAKGGEYVMVVDGTIYSLEKYFPPQFVTDMIDSFLDVYPDEYGYGSFRIPIGLKEINMPDVGGWDEKFNFVSLRSTGVHVKFSEKMRFGFYLNRAVGDDIKTPDGRITLYSESKLNGTIDMPYKDGTKKTIEKCFVATYRNGTDSEGNDKRYLCFEDWYNVINYDLNDVVFRVYGFDKYRPDLPDKPDDGDIIDEDEPKTPKWIIACEDLGNKDDFDFNDVVFQVDYTAGESTATITPLAAGGTLETYLCRTGHTDAHIGNEWHQNFVGGGAHTQMLNTYAGQSMLPGIPFTITVDPDNFRLAPKGEAGYQENMGGFFLEVVKDDGAVKTITPPVLKETNYSEAPQMILIFEPEGKPWCWPKERINIRDAYNSTGNPTFLDWVGKNLYDASEKGGNWSEYPTGDGYVIKR